MVTLVDRIGYDSGTTELEEAIETAGIHGIHYLNFNADIGPNHLGLWDDKRGENIKTQAVAKKIELCLHTLSSVNVAEFSPVVSDGVDEYLRANIDLSARLDGYGVVVHAGYHFNTEVTARRDAALERLKRTVEYAEQKNQILLLENLNFEPDDAEVHYMAHTIEETSFYLNAIDSPNLVWSFTVNHANLVPEGIEGFFKHFGVDRIWEVRLADNLGDKEIHMNPGEGNIDFESVFRMIESAGYSKFYSMNFGSVADRIAARDIFATYSL